MGVLPSTPSARSGLAHLWHRIHEQPVIRLDEPKMAQFKGNMVAELQPLLWEEAPHVNGQPSYVLGRAGANRREHKCGDPVGMTLGIRHREYRAPRHAKDGPPVDPKVLAQPLFAGRTARTGASVQVNDRQAVRGAELLVIEAMPIADGKLTDIEGLRRDR